MNKGAIPIKIQKKISELLYGLEFIDRKLMESSMSDKKRIIQNYLNIESLSTFYGWTKYGNHLVFFCKHHFSCVHYCNETPTRLNCYSQSSYFIYDSSTATLNVVVHDLQQVICISSGKMPRLISQKYNESKLNELHLYHYKNKSSILNNKIYLNMMNFM